jgi:hypothetical protein
MPEYTNGVCLIRQNKKHEIDATHTTAVTTIHKIVQYSDGKIVNTYYASYIYLKPMKIVLTSDKKHYWIQDAVVYKYDRVVTSESGEQMALFIGLSSRCAELIDPTSLKLCYQDEPKEPKKSHKRTKVLDTDKQTPVSSPVS